MCEVPVTFSVMFLFWWGKKYRSFECGFFWYFSFFFSSTCLRPYCIMWQGWGPRDIGHHPVFHSSAHLTDSLQHYHQKSYSHHIVILCSSSYRYHVTVLSYLKKDIGIGYHLIYLSDQHYHHIRPLMYYFIVMVIFVSSLKNHSL